MPAADTRPSAGRRTILAAYLVLGIAAAASIAVALGAGRDEQPTRNASGTYASAGGCLGTSFTVNQSGEFASLSGKDGSGGSLRLQRGALRGTLHCRGGVDAPAALAILGPKEHRRL